MRRLACAVLLAGALGAFGCADDDYGSERPATDASASVDLAGEVDSATVEDLATSLDDAAIDAAVVDGGADDAALDAATD